LELMGVVENPVAQVCGFSLVYRDDEVRVGRGGILPIALGGDRGAIGMGMINADNAQIAIAPLLLCPQQLYRVYSISPRFCQAFFPVSGGE
jgi:hypothetical protein